MLGNFCSVMPVVSVLVVLLEHGQRRRTQVPNPFTKYNELGHRPKNGGTPVALSRGKRAKADAYGIVDDEAWLAHQGIFEERL